MRRREFIEGFGGTSSWPRAGRAQQADRMRRIRVLTGFEASPSSKTVHIDDVLKSVWTNGFNKFVHDISYACARVVRTGHKKWLD